MRVGDTDWEEVRFFIDSGPGLTHFQVETDGLDVTRIVFGDGIHGAIPPEGETITVEYLETLGSRGNIGRNLVTEVVTPVYSAANRCSFRSPIPTSHQRLGQGDTRTCEAAGAGGTEIALESGN